MVYLPLIHNYLRFGLGDVRYWGILVLLSILFFSPKTYTNKLLIYVFLYWFFFYILSITLWVNVNDWNLRVAREEAFRFIVPLTLFTYFTSSCDLKGYKFVVKWTIIFIVITTILTIYSTSINPLYVRTLTSGSYSLSQLREMRSYGGGGYGFMSTLLCLLPILVYYIKTSNKKVIKFFTLGFLMLCYIAIFSAQLFANIIIATIIIIISFLGSKNYKKSMIYTFVFISISLMFPLEFFADALSVVSKKLDPGTLVYSKIIDMVEYLQYGAKVESESGTALRLSRYPLLAEAFLKKPLLGQFGDVNIKEFQEGGHLYWMNKLAVFGFINFLFFALIFYFFLKKILKSIPEDITFYFILSIVAGLGYGLLKQIMGIDFWTMFFLILPGVSYFKFPHLHKT